MIKKILYISLTAAILGGTVFIATYAGMEHRHLSYKSFFLEILNPQERPLITEEELQDTLSVHFGEFTGKDLDHVPLFDIEQFITSNPYVYKTNVYATLNGDISVAVETRVPLLRIINKWDENFLLDTLGDVMPLSWDHAVRVPVASGYIGTHFQQVPGNVSKLQEGNMLITLYDIARIISKDEFLDALIGQIYVNEDASIEFVPKVGQQTILFGDGEDVRQKLEKLKAFYLQVMKNKGWDAYKTINLTFENQVVCTK